MVITMARYALQTPPRRTQSRLGELLYDNDICQPHILLITPGIFLMKYGVQITFVEQRIRGKYYNYKKEAKTLKIAANDTGTN